MANRNSYMPQVEHDQMRCARLGFEQTGEYGFIRCVEHGSPSPLERWHCHDEYEIQLIMATRGRAFVGDYIGSYEPGHLCLVGPRLPHNWVPRDLPPEGVEERNFVVQFRGEPLAQAMVLFPELSELSALLENARHGIEFFGISERVERRYRRIRRQHGAKRFSEFTELLCDLARCTNYRLLSETPVLGGEDTPSQEKISKVLEYLKENFEEDLSLPEVGSLIGMTETGFSRYFRRATGSTFTEFVNQLRIGRACNLLMQTKTPISSICYSVGFNNISNFNRQFLKRRGMTPKEFRRASAERFGAMS